MKKTDAVNSKYHYVRIFARQEFFLFSFFLSNIKSDA